MSITLRPPLAMFMNNFCGCQCIISIHVHLYILIHVPGSSILLLASQGVPDSVIVYTCTVNYRAISNGWPV